jgi:predicted peroxiredoxin
MRSIDPGKRSGDSMRIKLLVFIAIVLMSGCSAVPDSQETVRDGVFIHISHGTDDPHRVAMALNMAVIMSEDRDVMVYFDIKGVEVVLKNAPDISFAQFPGSKAQLAALSGKGVTLAACPGCLEAAGFTPDDLESGITVAEKDRFFNFTKGRILTLDY